MQLMRAVSYARRARYATARQPLPVTHPHLFNPAAHADGHVVPGISRTELRERRERLLAKLMPSQMHADSLIVLRGNALTYATQDIFYDFQQNTDFLYLTGVDEPGCAATISGNGKFTLFLPAPNDRAARWEGEATSAAVARQHFGADDVLYMPKLAAERLRQHPNIVSPDAVARATQALRAVKSEAEIAVIGRSCAIAASAMRQTMRTARHLPPRERLEHRLRLEFERYSQREAAGGAKIRPAFVPVIASGENALTIHYTRNDRMYMDSELLLFDAGIQYAHYASDVARTFPVSGVFSPAQRDLYEVVLGAQKSTLSLVSPDVSLQHLQAHAVNELTAGLRSLPGFSFVTRETVEHELMGHFVGHHLGLDVHDCSLLDRNAALGVGAVITVEPGIYIRANDTSFPHQYRGIGIRIEDDVAVVTAAAAADEGKCKVLSADAPKELADIERLLLAHAQ